MIWVLIRLPVVGDPSGFVYTIICSTISRGRGWRIISAGYGSTGLHHGFDAMLKT